MQSELDLTNPEYYINRELSWLEFNRRVLEEAMDHHPLLDRLKFLSIFSSNLDEFFMVRVAGLKHQLVGGVAENVPDQLSAQEQLILIHRNVTKMVHTQYKIFREEIEPALLDNGISFVKVHDLNKSQLRYITKYFQEQVFAVLTPLAVDPGHPFPQLSNLSLNLSVLLQDSKKKNNQKTYFAVIQVPSVLKRFISVPQKGSGQIYIPLGEIMKHFSHLLFPGYKVMDLGLFRVTRDSDLILEGDQKEDLLSVIEEELRKRERGASVRIEIEQNMSPNLVKLLLNSLQLTEEDLFRSPGPLNLPDMMFIYNNKDLKHLREETYQPRISPSLKGVSNIFDVIGQKDVMLHHPYESFNSVIDFIDQAASDPKVLAIKLSLYRTSGDSPIIDALVRAVENGKQVTALIELKARFDEENNIGWARALEKAGVHVVYGFVGLKTHCKVMLVVRKEEDKLRRYMHLGTGNYNPSTAKLYTDMGIFTSREEFGADISELFNLLTGYYKVPNWRKIIAAPVGMKEKMTDLIEKEIHFHKQSGQGHIMAKMNSLVDADVIRTLYRASQAGVKIDLNVRGICCLRPGIPGVSDNIRVISIVDRFLEHSRIYYFQHGGQENVFIGSADWMPRNFIRRVEIIFPIEDADIKSRIIDEILKITFSDNTKARELHSDGKYVKVSKSSKSRVHSQTIFMQLAAAQEQNVSLRSSSSPLELAEIIRPRDYIEATESLGVAPETHQKRIQEKRPVDEEE